jgi:sugar phosphate isomerase/epimerase
MFFSRRDLAKLALAAPVAAVTGSRGARLNAAMAVNSKFSGVQIGVQTYSFRALPDPAHADIPTMQQIGINVAELMSEHAEGLIGAPAGRGGPVAEWRKSVSMDKFKDVRKMFDAAGLKLDLLCYNMNQRMTDDDIEYGFKMAQVLGVRAMTTSTQVSMAKRIAPVADKYKITIGFHGHDSTDPNEVATPESFATVMAASKYHAINLDIGHFSAAGFDPVAFIKEHAPNITNIHLKDRKKDHGANLPWGEGDTPIKEVLHLMRQEKYTFPANIEFEYKVPEGSDVVKEVSKCLAYCKEALA